MNQSTKKRLFIALNPPPEAKKKIKDIIGVLAKDSYGIKWVNRGLLHITLRFLGETDEATESESIKRLKALAGNFGRQEIILNKIAAFPGLVRPRVIILSGEELKSNPIERLLVSIDEALAACGLNPDSKPFKTHLTLGRVKSTDFKINWPENLNVGPIKFSLNTFALMSSYLTPAGPIYKVVAEFRL